MDEYRCWPSAGYIDLVCRDQYVGQKLLVNMVHSLVGCVRTGSPVGCGVCDDDGYYVFCQSRVSWRKSRIQ